LKILFITAWYPTKENPVNGVFVREHAKAVSLSGDEVVIIHNERSKNRLKRIYLVSDCMEEGIRTIRISYSSLFVRPVNFFLYVWGILGISKKLMESGFRPEVIHAHIFSAGVPAVILGKLSRIPVVITEHWHGFPQKKLKWTDKIMAKFAMNNAQWILPVSQGLQQGIEAYGINGRFQVVPNVVDPLLFHPIQRDPEQGRQKKILFVGLLVPVKGMPYLFQALARLRQQRDDWQVDIVGDGPSRTEYEHLAQQLGLVQKLTFHGMKSKQEVAEFMRRADLLVLPSLWENLPCVLIEAMASGLPVIATLTGGIPEIFHEELGILVPPGDTDRLCSALFRIMGSLDQFDRGKIAQRALSYRPEAVGKLIHSIYQDCVER
jgi:glycosyltransferase involved in cell wall biosynthesis